MRQTKLTLEINNSEKTLKCSNFLINVNRWRPKT